MLRVSTRKKGGLGCSISSFHIHTHAYSDTYSHVQIHTNEPFQGLKSGFKLRIEFRERDDEARIQRRAQGIMEVCHWQKGTGQIVEKLTKATKRFGKNLKATPEEPKYKIKSDKGKELIRNPETLEMLMDAAGETGGTEDEDVGGDKDEEIEDAEGAV